MGAGNDILAVLSRIEAKLDRLLAGGTGGADVAPASDLDSQWGDEEIRKDPPRWKGEESFQGKHMSECSPEFLDCFAEFADWKAERDEEKAAEATDPTEAEKKRKYSSYGRKTARRARGWAARKRSGWKPPQTVTPDEAKDAW